MSFARLALRSAAAPVRSFSTTAPARKHILQATPEQFKEALTSSRTTVVDFYADWCGPCKALTPILKAEIPEEAEVDLMTIDTDEQYEIAAAFKIAALPTVVAFRDGKPVGKFVGGRAPAGVKAFLEEIQA